MLTLLKLVQMCSPQQLFCYLFDFRVFFLGHLEPVAEDNAAAVVTLQCSRALVVRVRGRARGSHSRKVEELAHRVKFNDDFGILVRTFEILENVSEIPKIPAERPYYLSITVGIWSILSILI